MKTICVKRWNITRNTKNELRDAGIRQREYVLNVHSTEKVIDRLLALYRGETGYNNSKLDQICKTQRHNVV